MPSSGVGACGDFSTVLHVGVVIGRGGIHDELGSRPKNKYDQPVSE